MKRPTLVCLNRGANTVTRYIPKITGGFFTEVFAIIDREEFDFACQPETIEGLRLGKMQGQEYPEVA
jgi:hypothetical protein